MSRVLFIRHELLDEIELERVSAQDAELDLVGADDGEEMAQMLAEERFDALLAPYPPPEGKGCNLARLLGQYPRVSIICVVRDGDHRSAAEVAAHRPTDFMFTAQLRSSYAARMLTELIDRVASQTRESRLQHELERRNSELLGLNALASAVSSSLNREVIIRRALWVFGGLCRRGAAALIQLDPAPPFPDDHNRLHDDFSGEVAIECAGEFAVDGRPVCGTVDATGRWLDVIQDDKVVVVDASVEPHKFPGLEPLIERLGAGVLMLVPIWGQGRALGLLVLADLAAGSRMPFTREGLRAMASQLGAALENARLFEEVTGAYGSLKSTQDQLVHAEKFAAMGVLAAEIAHEINNPASFVISNLSVMDDYVTTIGEFLENLRAHLDDKAPALVETWEQLAEEHEIAFLREDLDTLLSRSLGGMQRIHQIVQDLRFFSHDAANEPGWIDIESLVESTLNLVKHEAKYRAELELDFANVPQIFSDANRLSQVFLNLLVNAAHAIKSGSIDDNLIRVTTRRRGGRVEVLVSDTGEGISAETLPRIFDPFFTTKEPGEGTGLGLSIARDIVRSLGGEISVSSTRGEGTTFKVTLPIRAAKFEADPELRDSGSFTAPTLGRDTGDDTGRDTEQAGLGEERQTDVDQIDSDDKTGNGDRDREEREHIGKDR